MKRTTSLAFICQQCSQGFVSSHALNCHLRIHSRDDEFKCSLCVSSFRRPRWLRLHALKAHGIVTRKDAFECELCTASFRGRVARQRHMEAAHHNASFGCATCGFRCRKRDLLYHHLRIHAAGHRPFLCETCSRAFRTGEDLAEHRKLHSSVWPFQCSICSVKFPQRSTLTRHLADHSNPADLSCKRCGQRCTSQARLAKHNASCGTAKSRDQKMRHVCRICNKAFASRCKFIANAGVHSSLKNFKCSLCPAMFSTPWKATAHRKAHSIAMDACRCSRCSLTLASWFLLSQHSRKCGFKRLFQCAICAQLQTNRSKLAAHLCVHAGARPYACNLCSARFTSADELWRHKRYQHANENKPFSCSKCRATFKFPQYLRRHEAVHATASYGCAHCIGFFSKTKDELRLHIRRHDPVFIESSKCQDCLKQFTCPKYMREHVRLQHSTAILAKPFKCAQCPAAFRRKKLLPAHLLCCHSNQRPFKCSHCSSAFKTSNACKAHLFKKHSGGPIPTPFQCCQCTAAFRSKCQLAEHRRCHSNERTFKCVQCSLTYKSESSLWAHMATHDGRLQCATCSATFEHKRQLRIHIVAHGNLRPYRCENCPAYFNNLYGFRHHRLRMHPDVSGQPAIPKVPRFAKFKCSQCSAAFEAKMHLQMHILRHTTVRPYLCQDCPAFFNQLGNYKRHCQTACHTFVEEQESTANDHAMSATQRKQ